MFTRVQTVDMWQARPCDGLGWRKMGRGNDPGLEMGQGMWQKVKGGEGG